MADAGKVAILPRGLWSAETVYEPLDLVYYNNNSFVALKESVGVTPVDGDTWMLSVSSIGQETIDAIINGTIQVGDSAKLGGKDASEYMLVKGVELNTSILEYALTLPNGEHFVRLSGNYAGGDLPAFNYCYGNAKIYKRSSQSVTVELIGSFTLDERRKAVNFYNSGTWSGWIIEATTADLANYLPLSGGKVSGNIEVVIDTPNQRLIRLKNSAKDIYLVVNGNGECGIYDNTNKKWIFSSAADGTNTFNGTATGCLPLSGGTITVNKALGLQIKRDSTDDTKTSAIFFSNNNKVFGGLGYTSGKLGVMTESGSLSGELHHDGNSAKVAIQETAPTDGLWVDTANKKVKVLIDGAWTVMA